MLALQNSYGAMRKCGRMRFIRFLKYQTPTVQPVRLLTDVHVFALSEGAPIPHPRAPPSGPHPCFPELDLKLDPEKRIPAKAESQARLP